LRPIFGTTAEKRKFADFPQPMASIHPPPLPSFAFISPANPHIRQKKAEDGWMASAKSLFDFLLSPPFCPISHCFAICFAICAAGHMDHRGRTGRIRKDKKQQKKKKRRRRLMEEENGDEKTF
jgi:hypothetical protein